MKEFLKLARDFRECPVIDDEFPLLRDRFDKQLSYMSFHLPKIVCLCGSTRFFREFEEANYRETLLGNIVLTVGFFGHTVNHGEYVGCTPEQKIKLDELHKRKIDLCDEVLVLNVGGYLGDSTRSEILYAIANKKDVRFLEPEHAKVVGL